MAKKVTKLEFLDIVMGADSQIIKQALEARLKIDDQLELRQKAYEQIATIEKQIEEVVGVEGEFIFPAPPLQVAGYAKLIPASRPAPKAPVAPKKEVDELKVKSTTTEKSVAKTQTSQDEKSTDKK